MTYTLTGRYPLGSLEGRDGERLRFVPSTTIVGADNIILPAPVPVTLDSNGEFSVALVGTDSPDYAPSGWVWVVQELMDGGRAPWAFELTADADIAELTAVIAPADYDLYVPLTTFQDHSTRHGSAGADPVTVAQSQVTGLGAALDLLVAKAVTSNVVFDGDSMVAVGSTLGMSLPAQVAGTIDARATVRDVSIGGQTLAVLLTTAATRVDALYASGALNVCHVWAGTNDLAVEAVTAATVEANLTTYCADRRAAGWKVIVSTILPRSDAPSAANFNDKRLAFNTWLRANWSTIADAMVDPAADARIGDIGDELIPAYFDTTKVHMTNTGRGIVAALARTALANLGVPCVAKQVTPSLWLPASVWNGAGAGESFAVQPIGDVWSMPHTGVPIIKHSAIIPADWNTFSVNLWWVNLGAGAGSATWRFDHRSVGLSSDEFVGYLDVPPAAGGMLPVTAAGQNWIVVSQILNANGNVIGPLNTGYPIWMSILRNGGTLGNAAGILGVMLEKAT